MIKEFVEAMISCKMKHTVFCAVFAAVAFVGSTAAAVGNPVWKQDFPDPTIWRAPDGSYRATSTALTILKSDDFRNWESTQKRVFTRDEEKRIRKEWKNIWAPEAYKLGDEYLMYVSLITCDTNSAIAVYSSKDPEGPFFGGYIITRSRDTGIRDTIDPEIVRDDRDGTLWLFFGSTGKMHRVRLAPDGKSLAPGAKYEHVAGIWGNEKSHPTRKGIFEGAYLHRRNGWWYLFASHGCYWNHTYSIAVGRAQTLDGPFLDRKGRKMTDGFATPVIESKKDDMFFGPGHNGEIVTIDGHDFISFHCHVAGMDPRARPFFVTELTWDKDGWPKGSLAANGWRSIRRKTAIADGKTFVNTPVDADKAESSR
jgi:arabinan endo-1,5-alpha-L-arabinosidase